MHKPPLVYVIIHDELYTAFMVSSFAHGTEIDWEGNNIIIDDYIDLYCLFK